MKSLHSFFFKRKKLIVEGIELKTLCLLEEIEILDLWEDVLKELSEIEDQNIQSSEGVWRHILELLSLSIINKDIPIVTIAAKKPAKEWLAFFKIYIINKIKSILYDDDLKTYFRQGSGEGVSAKAEKAGLIDLLSFVAKSFGLEALNHININQALILQRNEEIKAVDKRYSFIYDSIAISPHGSGNYFKEHSQRLNQIQAVFDKVYTDEEIAELTKKQDVQYSTQEELIEIRKRALQKESERIKDEKASIKIENKKEDIDNEN